MLYSALGNPSNHHEYTIKLKLMHIFLGKWMGILKIASDFMDSTMNNERLNMGEVVGEMMELIPIQI